MDIAALASDAFMMKMAFYFLVLVAFILIAIVGCSAIWFFWTVLNFILRSIQCLHCKGCPSSTTKNCRHR